IKLHPNLVEKNKIEVQKLIWQYEKKKNIQFLLDFSPIYPLLNFVDLYIGDASSIGYDFLSFDKPMFFLNQNKLSTYLFQCGIVIAPEKYSDIYSIIDQTMHQNFSAIRKQVYEET